MKRFILGCAAALALVALAPAAASATVTPGVQTVTDGAQCTANFIFRDGGGTYVGQAAHCSGTGAATDTNGCDSGSLPIGTSVQVRGGSQPGTLVYKLVDHDAAERGVRRRHLRVQRLRARPPRSGRCRGGRSLGARLRRAHRGRRPAEQRRRHGVHLRELLAARGVTKLSPKQGAVVQEQGGGWSRDVYTATPGIPGDSGSGFMDGSGRAIGVLSTVQIAPLAASNGVGNLNRELAYARAHGFGSLNLVPGTKPFNGNLVNAILGA